MVHINRFLGWSVELASGLSIGFNWVHGNGQTSKTSAILAGYHHPDSITWRWALYWEKPAALRWLPRASVWRPQPDSAMGSRTLVLPLVGSLCLRWQAHMFRKTRVASV